MDCDYHNIPSQPESEHTAQIADKVLQRPGERLLVLGVVGGGDVQGDPELVRADFPIVEDARGRLHAPVSAGRQTFANARLQSGHVPVLADLLLDGAFRHGMAISCQIYK